MPTNQADETPTANSETDSALAALRLRALQTTDTAPWSCVGEVPTTADGDGETDETPARGPAVVYEYDADPIRLHLHRAGEGPGGDAHQPADETTPREPDADAEQWAVTVDGRRSKLSEGFATSPPYASVADARRVATTATITVHALATVADDAEQTPEIAFDFDRLAAANLLAEALGEVSVAAKIERDRAAGGDDASVNHIRDDDTDDTEADTNGN